MQRILRSLLMCVLGGVFLLATGCAKSPLDRAKAFLDAGMGSDAVPLLQLEIQASPKNTRAHLLLGQAELLLGDHEAAQESFRHALLLDPGLSKRIGALYVDAASRVVSERPDIVGSYLEAAREYTHDYDRRIAQLYRGRALHSLMAPIGAAMARNALQLDPTLARDDTVAYFVAQGGQAADLERFLAAFPKSRYREAALIAVAYAAEAAGDYAKARACVEQTLPLVRDGDGRAQAAGFLKRLEAEQRAVAEAQATRQRDEVAAAAALERSRQARLLAQGRMAAVDAMQRAREAEDQARIAEAQAAEREREVQAQERRRAELRPILALLPGRWRFQNCAAAGLPEGYIDFQRVEPNGGVAGEFVFPTWYQPRTRFTGTVQGTRVELVRDVGSPENWTAAIDVSARTLTGTRDGGEFKDRSARKE